MTTSSVDDVSGISGRAAIQPLKGLQFRYAMSLLLALYVVNFLDRQVVNILAEPIKHDLKLADWQLGLLTGLSFALFYTVMGIPIARLAERYNRPVIIGISAAVWSGFTALCGITHNYLQLILARIGVGVGEAGCTPSAHSLIMDYTPAGKRSSALAFYGLGAPLGGLLGMAFGGLVADHYGWRTAFLLASLPGLVLAVLALLTLQEPRRILASQASRVKTVTATLGETFALMASRRSFRFLLVAILLNAMSSYGCAPFVASFYLRNHPEQLAQMAGTVGQVIGFNLQSMGFLGVMMGVVLGGCGMLGMLSGGQITDRVAHAKPHWYLLGPAIVSMIAVPIWMGTMVVTDLGMSLLLLGLHAFFGAFWYGPAYAAGLSVVPSHMRATTSAVLLFVINMAGVGLGPLAVGIVSDLFAARHGAAEGVRWALVTFGAFGLASAVMFWVGSRWLGQDMAKATEQSLGLA